MVSSNPRPGDAMVPCPKSQWHGHHRADEPCPMCPAPKPTSWQSRLSSEIDPPQWAKDIFTFYLPFHDLHIEPHANTWAVWTPDPFSGRTFGIGIMMEPGESEPSAKSFRYACVTISNDIYNNKP